MQLNGLKNDLIIGSSSQIAQYLPSSVIKISSRNIDQRIFDTEWNKVYICFAEQRTIYSHNKNFKDEFEKVNVDLTLSTIRKLNAKKIIYFSTVELWNNCNHSISLSTPFNFKENYYTSSKYKATKILKEMEDVIVLYPFNFNSRYRNSNFLMGKIFYSLLNKQKIEVGNLNWNRDILHAQWVANQAKDAEQSRIIGSGTYFNVKKYVKDLYQNFNMCYEDYVCESNHDPQRILTYLKSEQTLYSYDQLLNDTLVDLNQNMI